MPRVVSAIGDWLPKGWGDLGRQIGILIGVDIIYELGRGLADGSKAVAMHHGAQVISFERSTHTLFEPDLQKLFLPAHWLIEVANYLYLNAQFSVAIVFLFWLYLFHNDAYYFVRNMFVVAMCLALIGYVGFPTAPPRLFPQDGFTDTVTRYAAVNSDSSIAKVFINPYAAVPSMHCAFALMIGSSGVAVSRHWWSKALWACWPIVIAWVVIVTANHYWIDWALGWLVALTSFAIAKGALARWKPEAWDWRPARSRRAGPQEVEA
ncbi:MAG TPA: phosphatase PAP2 family protein [Solirubrobacterales bacterium]|nr:phosphatase PAP2 family protein [Solirubrobacterales bacterium]